MALPKVKISEAVELVKLSALSGEPILLVGEPGLGKSSIMDQTRLALGMDMILSHPVTGDSTDAKGFPVTYTKDGEQLADFIPYGDLRFAMKAQKPTLWFIDDLGQAPPSVQASYMQLLLAREINGKAISPHIRFAAATNGRAGRMGVSGILEPVKSRFGTIVELIADIDEFCAWGYKNKLYPTILGYLRFNSKELQNFQANKDMEQSPSPRTWHKLSNLLKTAEASTSLPSQLRHKLIVGAVGEGAAISYTAYEKVYQHLPDIDGIIANPDTFVCPSRPDIIYAIASSLAIKTTIYNIDQIVKLTARMPKQFGAVLMHDARAHCPDIDLTEAYGRWSESIANAHI
jgi:hypothetical protein